MLRHLGVLTRPSLSVLPLSFSLWTLLPLFAVNPHVCESSVASPKGETPSANQLVQPHSMNVAEWERPHYTTVMQPNVFWALLSHLTKPSFPTIFHLTFLIHEGLILCFQVLFTGTWLCLDLQREHKYLSNPQDTEKYSGKKKISSRYRGIIGFNVWYRNLLGLINKFFQ